MTEIVILIVICTALAGLSQKRSMSVDRRSFHDKERLCFAILTCYMIVFAGLRAYYNDTYAYIRGFANIAAFPDSLETLNWDLGSHPGYELLISIVKAFTDNYHIFLMIFSVIAIYPTIWFVRKYTKNFVMSLFILFMLGYYVFFLAAIKQTVATAIALIALDRYLNGKKISYFLYMLLAVSFHVYVLVYFVVPFLYNKVPWEKGTWIMILIVLVLTYSFDLLVNSILDATDALGDTYDDGTFTEDGINIFRVLVYFVPVLISFLWRERLFRDSSKTENLFVNLTIVCALIMFLGLFGTANMFSRLAIFFEPALHIALPWMLYKMRGLLSAMVLTVGSYVAFPIFFYYQMVIITDFDLAFKSITIAEFINSLFA